MIKLKGILKFKLKHGGNLLGEGYWDNVNSLLVYFKNRNFFYRIVRCLFLLSNLLKAG